MKNVELQEELDQWLADQGEKPEWQRSINPAGDLLFVRTNGLRLLLLDSAIEDNHLQRIIEVVIAFLIENITDNKKWVLDSRLTLTSE